MAVTGLKTGQPNVSPGWMLSQYFGKPGPVGLPPGEIVPYVKME